MNRLSRRVFISSLTLATQACALDPHEAAPKFRGKTMTGEKFDNDSLKSQVVLIQFWATWCGYCRGDQPAVESILDAYRGQGLKVLAVDVNESRKKVENYLRDNPRSCDIVLTEDTNLAAVYATRAFPLYVLLNKNGYEVGTQKGAGGEAPLRRLLAKADLRG